MELKKNQKIWWILDPSPFLGKHVLWSENKQKCNIFQYLYIDGQKIWVRIFGIRNSELLNHLDVENTINPTLLALFPPYSFIWHLRVIESWNINCEYRISADILNQKKEIILKYIEGVGQIDTSD